MSVHPPLQEHEAITSNVIELFCMNGQELKFNTRVKLSLSYSVTDLRGYQVVIKELIDKETNNWKDVNGIRDIRCCQDFEGNHPFHIIPPYQIFDKMYRAVSKLFAHLYFVKVDQNIYKKAKYSTLVHANQIPLSRNRLKLSP